MTSVLLIWRSVEKQKYAVSFTLRLLLMPRIGSLFVIHFVDEHVCEYCNRALPHVSVRVGNCVYWMNDYKMCSRLYSMRTDVRSKCMCRIDDYTWLMYGAYIKLFCDNWIDMQISTHSCWSALHVSSLFCKLSLTCRLCSVCCGKCLTKGEMRICCPILYDFNPRCYGVERGEVTMFTSLTSSSKRRKTNKLTIGSSN